MVRRGFLTSPALTDALSTPKNAQIHRITPDNIAEVDDTCACTCQFAAYVAGSNVNQPIVPVSTTGVKMPTIAIVIRRLIQAEPSRLTNESSQITTIVAIPP